MELNEIKKRHGELSAKGIINLSEVENKEFLELTKELINENTSKNFIFVYGSLRQGLHNFSIIERSKGSKFYSYGLIDGYRMFSLGSYPAITKTDLPNMKVFGEIWVVNDKVFDYINDMELGACYKAESVEIQTEQGKFEATIYTQPQPKDANYIEDGDWAKYLILDCMREHKK